MSPKCDGETSWEAMMCAALEGDEAAYACLLRAVAPVIRGIVRARGLSALGETGCEDVVQDVLLAIHLKRQTWRRDLPVRPWLYTIARHKVVDAFRARGHRIHVPVESFVDVLAAPEGPDPNERDDAEKLISALDPRSAEVLRAIGLNGESTTSVAARLGLSDGALRVVVHRALKRLATLRERSAE